MFTCQLLSWNFKTFFYNTLLEGPKDILPHPDIDYSVSSYFNYGKVKNNLIK